MYKSTTTRHKVFFFLISLDWDLTASSWKVPVDKKNYEYFRKNNCAPCFHFHNLVTKGEKRGGKFPSKINRE